MIKFEKLFALLASKGKPATNWLRQNGLHAATVNKLRHNKTVTTEIIEHLCHLLGCQPGDIMEYVKE